MLHISQPESPLYVQRTYVHVGKPIAINFRDLTTEEKILYGEYDYYKFEEFGPEKHPRTGSLWKKDKFDKVHFGCGRETSIDIQTAVNFATNPKFYRSARCSYCDNHFPVGEDGQFVWADTKHRVGV
jgi:hypothetical protein